MEQIEQCLHCEHRLFFKPLSNETFTCCFAFGETVEAIDIRTGVSPAIKKHGLEMIPCEEFKSGSSIFQDNPNNPFDIHPTRKKGEDFLLRLLTECGRKI